MSVDKKALKDAIMASVEGLRAVAVEVLADGEYPKALRYLAQAKDLDDFIRHEAFLNGE